MDLPTTPAYTQYGLTALQRVRKRCTSSGSGKFDIACTYPTLVLNIQYDFEIS
jgi:hypothetical protein